MFLHADRVAPEKAVSPARPSVVPFLPGSTERQMAGKFFEQYLDPRWQKLAARMKEAADWRCSNCGADDKALHVHHKQYFKDRKVWEYDEAELQVLCSVCHEYADVERESVKRLLSLSSTPCVDGLLAGFLSSDENIRALAPDVLASAREDAALEYAAGFIASLLCNELGIDQMHRVARYAMSLSRKNSEGRMRLAASGKVFGRDDDRNASDA